MFLTRLEQTLFCMLTVSYIFDRFGCVDMAAEPLSSRGFKKKKKIVGCLTKQEVNQVQVLFQ